MSALRCIFGAWLFFGVATVTAQSQDIMLLPINHQSGEYKVEKKPLHITYREGYDNQPKFSSDGGSLYFTRMEAVANSDEMQTDIYQYSLVNGQLLNVTQTPEHSEYSATPYGDKSISVIGVNPQGKQHLRLVELDSRKQKSLRTDIEPVGYHAWVSDSKAAVFVLGDVMTLQMLELQGKAKPDILASNIGRCLETMPNGSVSFTVDNDGIHELHRVDQEHQVETMGISLPKGTQDYVWLTSEAVIVGQDSSLVSVSRSGTVELVNLAELGVSGISRLALSPDKSQLAIVYNRP